MSAYLRSFGLALVAALLMTPAVQAQTRRERNAARDAYGRAQAAFEAEDFVASEAAFTEAFGIVPNPVVLLGLAEAQERQGKVRETVATLTQYLELREDAPDRAEIEARLQTLQQTPGRVSVTSEPAGAAISIDGAPSGEVTPATVELAPGEHTLALSLEGHLPAEQAVQVEFAREAEVALSLEAEPEPEPEPVIVEPDPVPLEEPEEETEEEDDDGPGAAVWIASGAAAAGVVAGPRVGVHALKGDSEVDDPTTQSTADPRH
ncbi:MAG: PEGA domain-containing protein, partial [Myxococcota bacterium]